MAQAEELPRWNTLHYFKWGDDSAGAPLRPRVEESTGEGGFHQFPVGRWWGSNSLLVAGGVGRVNILVPRCLLLRLRVPCRGHLEACLVVSFDQDQE